MQWETNLASHINSILGHYKVIDWLIIFFAGYFSYLLLIGVLYLWYREKSLKIRLESIFLVLISLMLSRGIFTEVIRFFYNRPRPFMVLENAYVLIPHASSPSFPSGHAAFFFALGFSLLYFNRRIGVIYLTSALFISIARVLANLHWISDILGGIFIALVSVFMIRHLLYLSWHKNLALSK